VLRQASIGKGTAAPTMMEILRKDGISGLWVGAIPTMARQALSVAVRFTVVEKFKTMTTKEGEKPNWMVSVIGGGIGGGASVILNNPVDVVKSKIQAGYQGGIFKCIVDIQKERGWKAWGAGLSARVPRLVISQAIQFGVFDYTLALLTTTPQAKEK